MPVKPNSRYRNLSTLKAVAPDGTTHEVISLRLRHDQIPRVSQVHRLTQGESLDLLARRFFGDERLWWRILDANPVIYPLDFQSGDKLNIPALAPATRITRARSF